MKGSQELAAELGPEQWHEVLDRFFSILTEAVHRYEGTVNQYTGDGIMALFGAPIAHEDHALRACLTALDLQKALREFGDELRLREGVNLSARIGMNSGEVVVGSIGDDLRMDYTAQGHSVGLAARMEQICEPGHIFVTEHVARQVQGYVQMRDLGEMQIKGSTEPVCVYDLESVGDIRTRLDASRARGLSRFVGRRRESDLLDDALTRTLNGEFQIVGVVANGGVGKSRLCFEFIERARSRGVEVCQGTGVPYAAAVPFYPLRGLIGDAVGLTPTDTPLQARRKIAGSLALAEVAHPECAKLVADFLGVSDPADPLDVPPEARQKRLFEIIVALFQNCSSPILIMLEDMHWIDEGSESFLVQLLERLQGSAVLLLLNYRPEYFADWLTSAIDLELPLSALGDDEMAELVDALLGEHESTQAVRQDIVARAGGNPFFVEEAVRALAEAGNLVGEAGDYQLGKALTELLIPDSVQALLASRIDRLGEFEKRVLQYAAVVGKNFASDEICILLEDERERILQALNELQESGFINTPDEAHFEFCHPIMQEVAYKAQLSANRKKVHAELAAYLETQAGDQEVPDERVVALAHHWQRAGELIKAAQWSLRTAVWFIPRDAAATYNAYRHARDLAAQSGQVDTSDEAAHIAIAARAGMVRSALLTRVDEAEVEQAYAEAKQIIEDTGDRAGLAELMISNGGRLLNAGDSIPAYENVTEAMRIAREIGDRDLQVRFRIPILLASFAAGNLREGLVLLEDGAETPWHAREVDLMNVGGRAFRALMLAYMGQLDEAALEMDRCIDLVKGQDRRISWLYANRVELACLTGDVKESANDAQIAMEYAAEYGAPMFHVLAGRAMARSLIFRGDPEGAVEALARDEALIAKGAPAHQFEVAHLVTWADALSLLNDRNAALAMARRAVASGEAYQAPVWSIQGRLSLVKLLLQSNEQADWQEAGKQLALAEAEVAASAAVTLQPAVDEQLGVCFARMGKQTQSNDKLRQAMAGYRQVGARGHALRMEQAFSEIT